jgi:SAM-dependent methyltransferase
MINSISIKGYYKFLSDYIYFLTHPGSRSDLKVSLRNLYPILNEDTDETNFDRHYIYHTAWAARILSKIKPKKHGDISSSLYFSSILSAFIPTDFYDYRPPKLKLSKLNVDKADLLSLPFKDNSIPSLSCMHTVEHIGLGRYGDPLDLEGDLKAVAELKRVIAPGGSLLFVVPVGIKSKIMFNAHRIYTYSQIMSYFDGFTLSEFVLIPENGKDGGLVKNPSQKLLKKQNYACGCFWFIKK